MSRNKVELLAEAHYWQHQK